MSKHYVEGLSILSLSSPVELAQRHMDTIVVRYCIRKVGTVTTFRPGFLLLRANVETELFDWYLTV